MNQETFMGRIERVFGTMTYKTKNGEERMSRKFWASESRSNNDKSKPNILEFEVNQVTVNPSSNVAQVADLDDIKKGNIVRFVFKLRGFTYTSNRTGSQNVWNKLNVCSRIELLESKSAYSEKNVKKGIEAFQKKALVAAKAQAMMENRDPDEVTSPF